MTTARKFLPAALLLACCWAGPEAAKAAGGPAEGPMRCGDQMNQLQAELKAWKTLLTAVQAGLPQVIQTASGLSTLYQNKSADGTPQAVSYFQLMANTLTPVSSQVPPVLSLITSGNTCMWNSGYMRQNNCFLIPLSCVDEAGWKAQVKSVVSVVWKARKDLTTSKTRLTSELPKDICYLNGDSKVWWERPLDTYMPCSKGSNACTYTTCSVQQVECRQHLSYSIDTLGQALDQILNSGGAAAGNLGQ